VGFLEDNKDKNLDEMSEKEKIKANICPQCDGELWHEGGCIRCPNCGFSLCGG